MARLSAIQVASATLYTARAEVDAAKRLRRQKVEFMDVQPISLATVYAGWEEDCQRIVASIAPHTDEELALRAAPHLRTIGHLAAHMVAARARMIHWILGEGDEELDALAVWDGFDQPAPRTIRSASDLVRGLETTGQAIQDALAAGRWLIWIVRHLAVWRPDLHLHTPTHDLEPRPPRLSPLRRDCPHSGHPWSSRTRFLNRASC